MRNQTSFRLTTTLLPTDMTAKTTTVINKVDSNGDKFYPTFTEETVVITNDDRTVMETTRAICTDWVLTFVKRGLSDDASETQVANRKLTWNPWSLCFITAGAGDWIDKDDNITWTGNQTYTGNLVSQWNATYAGRLITQKWVEYPHFDSLADLQAYADPFGWMFAVVDASGELYRYNANTEQRDVVTTSTPAVPEKASTTVIWIVRGATDAEFAAEAETWENGELLVATPKQIATVTPAKATTSTAWIVRWATATEFTNWTGTGSGGELLVATPAQIANMPISKLFVLTGTTWSTNLATAQAAFNFYKAWGVPMIKYPVSSLRTVILYFDQDTKDVHLSFYSVFVTGWSNRDRILFNYTWSTVSSIEYQNQST